MVPNSGGKRIDEQKFSGCGMNLCDYFEKERKFDYFEKERKFDPALYWDKQYGPKFQPL